MSIEIQTTPGQHITSAAFNLAAAGPNHHFIFNDIRIDFEPSKSADDYVKEFYQLCEERRIAYKNSPEGKADQEKSNQDLKRNQEIIDKQMTIFSTLDFSNHREIMTWIEDICDATDRVGVQFDRQAIIRKFNQHGFTANMNTGANYQDGNASNMAGYVVGQVIACLETVGSIHHMCGHFAKKWKANLIESLSLN